MRRRLLVLGYLALFWLAFHVLLRAIFMLYNADLTEALTPFEIFQVFLHGLKMDISMTGYFMMAAGLILTLSKSTARIPPTSLQKYPDRTLKCT